MVYAVGGRNNTYNGKYAHCERYDPASNTWTARQPLPEAADGQAAAVIDNILYLAGGWAPSGTVRALQAYNPATNTWTSKANTPTMFSNGAADAYGGRMYVFATNYPSYDYAYSYDPITNLWTTLSSPTSGRQYGAAIAYHGYMVQIGGVSGCATIGGVWTCTEHSSAEAYDISTGTWQALPSAPAALVALGLTLAPDNTIYAFDGGRPVMRFGLSIPTPAPTSVPTVAALGPTAGE